MGTSAKELETSDLNMQLIVGPYLSLYCEEIMWDISENVIGLLGCILG
jgi:hypothetical protein